MLPLLIIAVLVILALFTYAVYLLRQVKMQEESQKEALQLQKDKDQQRVEYITESLQVISLNVLDEDLNLSEATIRCKHLLDALFLPIEHRERYQLLDEVYEQIQGFATHKARRELDKNERRKQDQAREDIEKRYSEKLIALFTELREFKLPV